MPQVIDHLESIATIFGAAVFIVLAVILYTRIAGLRSFSKMSSFDFAITVAVGSVVATGVIGPDPKYLQATLALAALFVVQTLIARGRRWSFLQQLIDNEPMFLMRDGEMLHANMHRCRVTEDDLRAKLREANVLRRCEVHAVVLETTGDISVLHGKPETEGGASLEAWLTEAVRRG